LRNREGRGNGWEAIDQALEPLYHGQEPCHYATLINYQLGGPDPLPGISAYKRLTPEPHWHFITYGFSELYEKVSENKDFSGWGFELTFRLKTKPETSEPPLWALNFLQNLARYVFESGNIFKSGDYLNANGPIALEEETHITALAFTLDPELPPIDTPNGYLEFLQVVGITDDEELAVKIWSTQKVLKVFSPYLPLYITDLHRESLLNLPQINQKILEGARQEGSHTGYLYGEQLDWTLHTANGTPESWNIVLGAKETAELLRLLPYRLPFVRELSLVGNNRQLTLRSTESCLCVEDEDGLELGLSGAAIDEIIKRLQPQAGIYHFPSCPKLHIEVRRTTIQDNTGKIIRTLG